MHARPRWGRNPRAAEASRRGGLTPALILRLFSSLRDFYSEPPRKAIGALPPIPCRVVNVSIPAVAPGTGRGRDESTRDAPGLLDAT